MEFLPLDATAGRAGAVVYLRSREVLFAGPLVVHGPRSRLAGSDTAAWLAALRRLDVLGVKHVVPGFGSWGGLERIVRQRRFLAERRRQVGYQIRKRKPSSSSRTFVQVDTAGHPIEPVRSRADAGWI